MNEELKKQLLNQIISEGNIKTSKDISELFSELQGMLYQTMLDAEYEVHMGKEALNSKNKKNGYTTKNPREIKTKSGVTTKIHMPRDRNGEFEPVIVPKRKRIVEDFSELSILLYSKGNSLEDIEEIIKKLYKVNMSKTYISELITKVSDDVKTWQERALKSIYAIAYIDCLHCSVKVDGVSKKVAVYVIIGINLEGKKEILSIEIGDGSESASFWTNVLYDLKIRGVEDIIYIALDGLSGLKDSVESVYPLTKTQRCIVHIVRNLYKISPKKEVKEIIKDFKKIYQSLTKEEAKEAYKDFTKKYNDREKIIKYVENNIDHIYNLFEEPKEIRKLIYTTNQIESVNSALRKVTNGKGAFMNKESLMRVLYLRVKDLEKKWSKEIKSWNKILNDLIDMYEERITKHL